MRILRSIGDEVFLFLTALAVRGIYLFIHTKSIYFNRPILDSLWIHQWAASIAAGEAAEREAFFRAPLYPYFVSAVYTLFGARPWVLEVIQHVLGALSVVVVYRIGKRLFDRRTGLLAGLLLAFYWIAVFFEGELLIVTLVVFLLTAALHALVETAVRETAQRRWIGWAVAGLLLGLAGTARPNVLLFVPIAVFWAVLVRRGEVTRRAGPGRGGWRGAWRAGIGAGVIVTAGAVLPVLTVTVRNLAVAGDFVLISSQGGLNFYIGNGPGSDGKTAAAPAEVAPMSREDFSSRYRDNVTLAGRQTAELAAGRRLKGSEVSRYWFRRALESMQSEPGRTMRLMSRKIYYLFNSYEISNNKDLNEVKNHSIWSHVALVRLWWTLPFAWVGLVVGFLGVRERQIRSLIVLFLLTYSISIILFFVNARFRLPLIPVGFLLSSVGIWRAKDLLWAAWARWRRGKWMYTRVECQTDGPRLWRRDAITWLFVLVVGCTVSNTRLFGIADRPDLPGHRVNRAMLLLEAGECAAAIQSYDEALAIDPHMLEARFGRARALERCGQVDSALAEFSHIVRDKPDFVFGHLARARLLAQLGRQEEADSAYRAALEVAPRLADAHLNYAGFLLRSGEPEKALEYFEGGLALDPDRLIAWINYGYTLAALGRMAEAIGAWEKALAIDPGNEVARSNIQRATSVLETR